MAKGAAEGIDHCNGVRLRVLGSGDLQMRLLSLPDVNDVQIEFPMLSLDMDTMVGSREPLTKANFSQQRMQLEIKVTEIDEYFSVNKIIFFLRPVATNYPG